MTDCKDEGDDGERFWNTNLEDRSVVSEMK